MTRKDYILTYCLKIVYQLSIFDYMYFIEYYRNYLLPLINSILPQLFDVLETVQGCTKTLILRLCIYDQTDRRDKKPADEPIRLICKLSI